jgi:hypothetical protein
MTLEEKNSGACSDDGTAFNCALGEILGQLGMPLACLGRNCTLGSRPLFCSTTQIETLVRHHWSFSPGHHFGAR